MTGPKDIPAIKFIGVDGHEMQEEDSPSYFNLQECSKIAEQVYLCSYPGHVGWLWGTCTMYVRKSSSDVASSQFA